MGFFDDAGIDANDVPEDQFGFGNDYWPTRIVEVKPPEVTKNGQRFGLMIKWAVEHPKFDGHYVSTQGLGYGNWQQLPVPKALQGSVPWDPNSDEARKCLFQLRQLYTALGFSADKWGSIGEKELLHSICLSKIKVTQDENGFWQFRLNAQKPMDKQASADGHNEFAPKAQAKTDEELMREEMDNI